MQMFASRPNCAQVGPTPFSQPSLLATLLIPQLEAYFSSNDFIHLLVLHYPASHISTILALKDLLGPVLLKVAGIVNLIVDKPFAHNPFLVDAHTKHRKGSTASVKRQVSNKSLRVLPSPEVNHSPNKTNEKDMQRTLAFNADFLLTSPATESEFSIFLSLLLETYDKSSFSNSMSRKASADQTSIRTPPPIYEPIFHPPPHSPTSVASHRRRKKSTGSHSAHSKKSTRHAGSASSSPTLRTRDLHIDRESPWDHDYDPGSSRLRERERESPREKLERQEREKEEKERQSQKDWENFYVPSVSEDEDEEDEMDRILMPRVPIRGSGGMRDGSGRVAGVGSLVPRKALRFLGLS